MQARCALAFLISCLAMPSIADAEPTRVAVMTDAEPLQSALRVSLAGRGADVELLAAPPGELRLERAGAAQQAVHAIGAHAGVWIDQADTGMLEVYVVSADGRFLRHAPLPDASPRLFAAIATSLLDELFVPPEGSIDVDVHVDITAPPVLPATPLVAAGGPSARLSAVPILPLGTAQTVPPSELPWARQPVFEVSSTASPVSVGVSAGILMPIHPRVQVGVFVAGNLLTDGVNDMKQGTKLWIGAVEARIVGSSGPSHRHLEAGFLAGAAYADDIDEGGFVATRLSVVFEGARSNIALSLMPAMLVGFRGSNDYLPSALVALSWELPL